VECRPAFNYGRQAHTLTICREGARFDTEALSMRLSSTIPLKEADGGGAIAEFRLKQGESALFILSECQQGEETPPPPNEKHAEELFQETVKYWRGWLAACNYRGRWREQVERSALSLKLLTYEPTGAIVAAPTCSLPEAIGGSRNWDYRYTWIRDAAFTVYALLRIGFKDEAAGFVDWLDRFSSRTQELDDRGRTLLTIHGEVQKAEEILDHWEGYRGSGPVRIGNAASAQFQSDIFGEAMDSLYLYNKHVSPISSEFWYRIRDRLDWICDNWQRPDSGIWEMRGVQRDFVYSKVMNWVALDRGTRLAEKRSFPANRARWVEERDKIYEEVMSRGWNAERHAFTQSYGSDALDASLLMMPLVFFMAPTDPRMLGTLDAIMRDPSEGGLVSDSLVHRYPPGVDGLPGDEGTFNMCSFWLVEALTRAGEAKPEKLDEARIIFERMLGYANHLGLYSEQTGSEGQALGNFPQAFTHLALISSAFNLDRVLGKRP
jgi:GH15 family glucan-1,4-alpha-glucosidase